MNLSYSALCYLHAWEQRVPLPHPVAFEPLLRRISLDYSLASLARVDTFLDALRTAKKPERNAFLDVPANQTLLYLLNFYVGEVMARGLGVAPRWMSFAQAVQDHPDNAMFGEGFESSAIVQFPSPGARVNPFLPLVSICSRLFDEHVTKSVLFSAQSVYAPGGAPANNQPLPPPPSPPWPVDIQKLHGLLSPGERARLALEEPPGISQDPLIKIFQSAPALLQGGRVVWAALIQANNDLFKPQGYAGAPGEVLYDPAGRVPTEVLAALAQHLMSLKNQQPADPQLARYAAHLAGETSRAYGFALPPSFSAYPLKASTTWFQRNHLPGNRITQACFPVLVHDEHPGMVLFLPAPFWPRELLEAWS